jgi:glycosyltransferase involved in cell wall biosynthesis
VNGIGDYTALIAARLMDAHSVRIITATGAAFDPIPGVQVEQVFSFDNRRSVRGIAETVAAAAPDWIILQYQPFAYGRWGLNLDLPIVIKQIRQRNPATRVAVMFHEPFVEVENWQFAVMTTWQRSQFMMLGNAADIVFFSIDPWARRFKRWFRSTPVVHLPVGSNIPYTPIARSEARSRLGLGGNAFVVGLFGTMHVSRMLGRVGNAARAARDSGLDTVLLYVGPDADVVRKEMDGFPLIAEGPFPGDEISRRFAAMDVYLSPFVDGISTRRGSLMCGLQHGIATVGTRAHLTDDILSREDGNAFLLADASDPNRFNAHVLRLAHDEELRGRIGEGGRRLFESAFSWSAIANRMISALETAAPRGPALSSL